MKLFLVSALMITAAGLPFGGQLAAQTHTLVADIPFSFVATDRIMPAGRYLVSEMRSGSTVFTFRDADGHSVVAMLGTMREGKPDKPSLTFSCLGKECVLAKVTPPDSMAAYSLSQDSIDRHWSHRVGIVSLVTVKLKAH